uniref:non-specific serine/threonine protein kinase n=1 Tax=Timema californicum TaxID=61474 RepID=A0A7R9P5W0_TIMCA|nr:unnamed protein product [Timema californicum]
MFSWSWTLFNSRVMEMGSNCGVQLDHNLNNFATIRTTSIVTKEQKEHMQEEMHEQMTGYKRMRREHQAALLKVLLSPLSTPANLKYIYNCSFLEERCKFEMESHKQILDKEYESLLQQFSKDLDRIQVRNQQELERKVFSASNIFRPTFIYHYLSYNLTLYSSF